MSLGRWSSEAETARSDGGLSPKTGLIGQFTMNPDNHGLQLPDFILHDVDWTVAARDRWVVIGPNGSGKTTLLSALLGEVDPAERMVLCEDATELAPAHPHVVRLLTFAGSHREIADGDLLSPAIIVDTVLNGVERSAGPAEGSDA